MNWITNYVRPRINSMLGRREMPENLWIKDPESGEMVFHKDLESNQFVIPSSGHHMKISARERLKFFFDDGRFEVIENPRVVTDPLKFRDEKRYTDRLKDAKAKTGLEDAIVNAVANVLGPKGEKTADPAEAVATLVSGLAQGVHSARLAPAE